MELPNWHPGQPHLLLLFILGQKIPSTGRPLGCFDMGMSWGRRPPWWEFALMTSACSYIIPNRHRKDQQREPEWKRINKLVPLSNGSNLNQNYPSPVMLLQEFLDSFLSQLQRKKPRLWKDQSCVLWWQHQRSNSIKGTQKNPYFYSCNLW